MLAVINCLKIIPIQSFFFELILSKNSLFKLLNLPNKNYCFALRNISCTTQTLLIIAANIKSMLSCQFFILPLIIEFQCIIDCYSMFFYGCFYCTLVSPNFLVLRYHIAFFIFSVFSMPAIVFLVTISEVWIVKHCRCCCLCFQCFGF